MPMYVLFGTERDRCSSPAGVHSGTDKHQRVCHAVDAATVFPFDRVGTVAAVPHVLHVPFLRFHPMADNSSRSHAPAALLDNDPDVLRCATCPMCDTPTSVTQNAIEAGGDWRCVRCGQHWDAARLAAVAAYATWTVDRD